MSERQLQNRAYAEQASRRLAELWWWDGVGRGRSVALCALSELGRIEDYPTFAEAAWWLCTYTRGLTAKQTAAEIKRMRTGKTLREGPAELFKRLMRTVDDFRADYPGASSRYLEREVELVLRTIRSVRGYTR